MVFPNHHFKEFHLPVYVKAILLNISSIALLSVMSMLIKIATQSGVPIGQVMFFRNFFALILIIIVITPKNLRQEIATNRFGGHLLRSFVGAAAMACIFYTLFALPLAQATVISFAAPLITVIFSVILLKEVVRIYRWMAVIAGLMGVVVMMWPQLSQSSDGQVSAGWVAFAIAMLGASLMSLAKIQIRRLAITEKTLAIVFYFSLFSTFFSLLSVPFGWIMPPLEDFILLILVGLVGGAAQICLTQSFKRAEASALAPFEYTALLFAVFIDITIFAIYPSAYVLIGAAIVICSGLFVIYRERKLQIERKSKGAKTPLGV